MAMCSCCICRWCASKSVLGHIPSSTLVLPLDESPAVGYGGLSSALSTDQSDGKHNRPKSSHLISDGPFSEALHLADHLPHRRGIVAVELGHHLFERLAANQFQ